MMHCGHCRKKVAKAARRCPHCGRPIPEISGTFQTSVVMISAGPEELVYRTVDEVPPPLRTRLLESTNSGNSGTILIADRRGRTEIARALRRLPSRARLRGGVAGLAAAPAWLTPRRRRGILALLTLACLALIGAVFAYRW
jgi:hypothetical protein